MDSNRIPHEPAKGVIGRTLSPFVFHDQKFDPFEAFFQVFLFSVHQQKVAEKIGSRLFQNSWKASEEKFSIFQICRSANSLARNSYEKLSYRVIYLLYALF
jgi:hypothetical protein